MGILFHVIQIIHVTHSQKWLKSSNILVLIIPLRVYCIPHKSIWKRNCSLQSCIINRIFNSKSTCGNNKEAHKGNNAPLSRQKRNKLKTLEPRIGIHSQPDADGSAKASSSSTFSSDNRHSRESQNKSSRPRITVLDGSTGAKDRVHTNRPKRTSSRHLCQVSQHRFNNKALYRMFNFFSIMDSSALKENTPVQTIHRELTDD